MGVGRICRTGTWTDVHHIYVYKQGTRIVRNVGRDDHAGDLTSVDREVCRGYLPDEVLHEKVLCSTSRGR